MVIRISGNLQPFVAAICLEVPSPGRKESILHVLWGWPLFRLKVAPLSFDHTLPCSGVTAMAFKHHLLFMLLLAPRVLGIRVIVAGLGRTGTLSMLSALKILGHWVSLMCIDDARF